MAPTWYIAGNERPLGPVKPFVSSIGISQINVGLIDWTEQTTINLLHEANAVGFNSGATPAALDTFGYPIRNFSGSIQLQLDGQTISNGPWIFSWGAGRSSFQVIFSEQASIVSSVNCTTSTSGGVLTVTGDGVNSGSVTFNWVGASPSLGNMKFDGTYTSWANNTSGSMSLVRQSDQASYNAGNYWTPEFVSLLKSLKPRSIRTMGWVFARGDNVDTNEALWAYRRTINDVGFRIIKYPPSVWSGGGGTSGNISVSNGALTAALATDSSASGWNPGEVLLGNIASTVSGLAITGAASNGGNVQLTVSSTTGISGGQRVRVDNVGGTTEANGFQTVLSVDSTSLVTLNVAFVHTYTSGGFLGYQTLTVTGKSGGAKVIVTNTGQAIGTGFSNDTTQIVSGVGFFVYDQVLDALLYGSDGITPSPPLEAMANLANLVGCRLWYNVPTWATDNYVTNALNVLNSSLTGILELEYSNEMWNFAFPGRQWADQRGGILGLGSNDGLDFQALRIRQIMGNLVPASNYGAQMSKINRIYAIQGGVGFGDTGITFYFNGGDLVSPGNAAYQAFVGGSSVNYNIKPGRPIDVCDSIAYAPYTSGNAVSGTSPDSQTDPTTFDAALLQSIIDNTNAGGSGIATATALIDNNMRQGTNRVQTVTASGTTFTTPSAHNFSVGDTLQFTVSGGTAYSGVNIKKMHQVLSTPLTTTFTCGVYTNDILSSAINAGSAGSGTMSVGDIGQQSDNGLFALTSHWYTKWESVAASYDTDRPGGVPPLKVQWYEGALEPTAPSTAQCTTLGLVSPNPGGTAAAASAVIATAITNWKNDPMAALTLRNYYDQFMGSDPNSQTFGAMPHSTSPSQLNINGPTVWSVMANDLPASPQVYQTFVGIQTFNTVGF